MNMGKKWTVTKKYWGVNTSANITAKDTQGKDTALQIKYIFLETFLL